MVLERSKPCSNECKASHEHAAITVMMQFFDLSVASLVPYMGESAAGPKPAEAQKS